MDHQLFNILNSVHTDSKSKCFKVCSLYGPEKDWNIEEKSVSGFWKGYCEIVDNGFDRECSLAEVPNKIMPVILDFSFKFERKREEIDNGEPYENELVYLLVGVCQKSIKKLCDLKSNDSKELICCYLESETMWSETIHNIEFDCVKIRLQFPFCRVDATFQETKLRNEIVKELESCNASDLFLSVPKGDWDDIIDKRTVTKPVVMYGSAESIELPRLELNNVWSEITEEDLYVVGDEINFGEIDEIEPSELFYVKDHGHVRRNLINPGIYVDNSDDVDYWMPLFLSIVYCDGDVIKPKREVRPDKGKGRLSSTRKFNRNKRKLSPSSSGGDLEGNHLDIAKELLPLLDGYRFTERSYWEEIGNALYSASEGSEKGLALFVSYTEDFCSERVDECEDFYRTCTESRITVKTIAWYAREDDPNGYKEWHTKWCLGAMEQALSCLDNDIARCFYKVYWLDYLCTYSGSSFKWWQYHNHTWHDIHKGIRLKRKLSSQFHERFERMRVSITEQMIGCNDETFRIQGELNVKKIGMLLKRLRSTAPKSKVMVEAIEYFLHDDFEAWTDDNDNLTGVKNGVLEVCGRVCIFRTGKPEDFITKTTMVVYDEKFYMEHPRVQECLVWINQVFPDKALARHFLKYCASFLKSGNREKYLMVFTGKGDNSKSMICKLIGLLGGYCVRLPVTCITQGRQRSSGPNPEMARAKSAKVAIMQEPENEDILQGGIIKDLTGGEPYFARFLNDNGGEIKNTFKTILMCNEIPTFTNPGKAVKNRVRIMPFLSTWVRDAPKDPDEQYATRTFQMDEHFEDRIKYLMPAFLWLMKEYYSIYAVERLDDPPIIAEHTQKYWRENDIYAQYTDERICQAVDANGSIDKKPSLSLTKVYNDFKMFMQDNYPSSIVPDRKHVRINISEHIGQICGRAWYGVRFNQEVANVKQLSSNQINESTACGLPVIGGLEHSEMNISGRGILGV